MTGTKNGIDDSLDGGPGADTLVGGNRGRDSATMDRKLDKLIGIEVRNEH